MFEYHLTFRNTSAHANADALSRLPLPTQPALDQPPPELVLLADQLSSSPVTAKHIQVQTNKDVTMATALQYVLQGWPNRLEPQSALQPYFERRTELSIFQGCLLWGSQVVIPAACQQQVGDLEQVVLAMAIEIRHQLLHEHSYFRRLGGIQTLTSTETISHGLRLIVKPACPRSTAPEAACGL